MSRKIEFSDKRKNISDQEIESYMDFESLIDKSTAQNLNAEVVKTLTKRFLYMAGLVGLLGLSLWLYNRTTDSSNVKGIVESPEPLKQEVPVFTEDIDTVRQKKVVDTLIGPEKAKPVNAQKEKSTQKVIAQKPAEEENVAAQTMDQQPQYNYQDATPIDGIESLYDYFDVNLKYPSEGLTDSIEGTVIVKFTVKDNGKIDNITIQKSLGDAFDIEAIRLIENMPPWKPATVNEIPIDSKLSIPLHFKVQ